MFGVAQEPDPEDDPGAARMVKAEQYYTQFDPNAAIDEPVQYCMGAKNPGSKDHPHGCKPCNKFNPARPDSCKHGDKCDFCHCQHERPKHRGQRGRHALQRRQYLEARADQPQFFVDLVDQIYARPHQAIDEVKRRLPGLPIAEREQKVGMVLKKIRDIGIMAQNERPDKMRLRGAQIECSEETTCSVAELDGRCKWLVGTLHLMVRKMLESRELEETIKGIVLPILKQCDEISQVIDESASPSHPEGRASDTLVTPMAMVRLPKRYKSLEAVVDDMVKRESVDPESDIMSEIRKEFEELAEDTSSMNESENADLNRLLYTEYMLSGTLSELLTRLKDIEALEPVQRFKERLIGVLFEADTLEDCGAVQNQTVPSHDYKVRWKERILQIPLPVGTPAETLREEVADRLSKSIIAQIETPNVQTSQVRLGIFGLSVELDYHKHIPEAAREDLQASLVQRNWQDILMSWSSDDFQRKEELIKKWLDLFNDWSQQLASQSQEDAEFCRTVGIIGVLHRKFKGDACRLETLEKIVFQAVESHTLPSAALRDFQLKFDLEPKVLKAYFKLLGEPDARLGLKLDGVCQFLNPTVNRLTQEALYKGGQLARIRALQDEIYYECQTLPSALSVLPTSESLSELQDYLMSSTSLECLRLRLRESVT